MDRKKREIRPQSYRRRTWPFMQMLLLSLLLIGPLAACYRVRVYPAFPLPTPHVAQVLDDVGEKDKAVWEWLGKLRVLCIQLGTCKEVK